MEINICQPLPEVAIRAIGKPYSHPIELHVQFKLHPTGMMDIHIVMTRTSIIEFMYNKAVCYGSVDYMNHTAPA